MPYKYFIGGITNMASNVYRQINGFSNQYEGWGLEDDDFYRRYVYIDRAIIFLLNSLKLEFYLDIY